jgi:hypothetical protein
MSSLYKNISLLVDQGVGGTKLGLLDGKIQITSGNYGFRRQYYALSGTFPFSTIEWEVTTPPITVYAQVQNTGMPPVAEDWEEQINGEALTVPSYGANVDGKILWVKEVLESGDSSSGAGSVLAQIFIELSSTPFVSNVRKSSFFLVM